MMRLPVKSRGASSKNRRRGAHISTASHYYLFTCTGDEDTAEAKE